MSDAPTILDLISNHTLSMEMAATMWAFVSEQRSFITAAVPRLAGKSIVADAVLSLRPPAVPVHELDGSMEEMDSFKLRAVGGYLSISEISQGPFQNYIWGEPTRRLFATLDAGYSLVATMHASGLEDIFEQICAGNGVGDDAASHIGFVIYIRRFGDEANGFWRRVTEVHEIHRIEGGRASGSLLHKWHEDDDSFEVLDSPMTLQHDGGDIVARVAVLREVAESERRSASDVAELVDRFAPRG